MSLYPAHRRDSVQIPTIWIAVALSLLIHLSALWQWPPKLRFPSPAADERGPLVVRILPPPSPPAPPPAAAAPRPPPRMALPQPRAPKIEPARPRATPPVIALNEPKAGASAPRPGAPTPPPAARISPEGDLASLIEANRRSRGGPPPSGVTIPAEPSSSAESENERATRLAAANLGLQRKPTFGKEPTNGGGIFSIKRMSFDSAEFHFFGWNKDIRRNTTQLVEVRRGNNPDIKIAVVRKMIAIIREYEQADFVWESKRLERNITLSARARDTAGLEEFLMREFFEDPRQRW